MCLKMPEKLIFVEPIIRDWKVLVERSNENGFNELIRGSDLSDVDDTGRCWLSLGNRIGSNSRNSKRGQDTIAKAVSSKLNISRT